LLTILKIGLISEERIENISFTGRIGVRSKHKHTPNFNIQLMHPTLKTVELLKHFKISKIAATCFGLQGNNHQGATIST
jgi:hypothetical protein